LLIISLLSFPVTMNYFSPYVIIHGASQGIVNGSFIMFTAMFLSSMFVGRLWCGWACPAGGLGEVCTALNDQTVNGKRIDWIKWLIWVPWIAIIAWAAVSAGGYRSVNFFLDTVGGISVAGDADRPVIAAYAIYYIVLGIFFALAVFVGRRAGCYAICWMAPFMILGRKLRNLFAWPSLRLQAETGKCTSCLTCNSNCPMSLDVNSMVQAGRMENSECILCGSCVDGCPSKAIHYSYSVGK